jgi:hypothetical protein
MASPRISVVLVIAGVLAVTGGAAYYFFAVFSAGERLHAAQAQVAQWETQWQAARACVLGQQPMAATIGDAIAGRELSQGSAEAAMGDCTRSIGKLTRPDGNNTGMEVVEEAWQQIDQLAMEVARRYVAHLQNPLEEGKADQDTFAGGLQQLAEARTLLRKKAMMPPDEGVMGPPPRELLLAPLSLDGQPLTELGLATLTASGERIGRVAVGDRWLVARLRKGEHGGVAVEARAVRPEVMAAPPATVSAIPWGITSSGEVKNGKTVVTLLAGPLDADGAVTPPGVVVASAPAMRATAVLEAGASRVALYTDEESYSTALSQDGGATWKSARLAPFSDTSIFAGDGFIDVAWNQPGKGDPVKAEVVWQRLEASKLPVMAPPRTLPGFELRRACGAPSAPWAILRMDNELRVARLELDPGVPIGDAGEQGSSLPTPDVDDFVDCDDQGVLLNAGGALWSCRRGEEKCQRFPWRASSGMGTVVAGAPVVVTARKQLLAVLTAEAEPILVNLPADTTLHALYSLGSSPLLVLKRKSGELAAATLLTK